MGGFNTALAGREKTSIDCHEGTPHKLVDIACVEGWQQSTGR
jgi:hypothetical protein